MPNEQEYLTVSQFAVKNKISRQRIYMLLQLKKLPYIEQYGLILIPANATYEKRKGGRTKTV